MAVPDQMVNELEIGRCPQNGITALKLEIPRDMAINGASARLVEWMLSTRYCGSPFTDDVGASKVKRDATSSRQIIGRQVPMKVSCILFNTSPSSLCQSRDLVTVQTEAEIPRKNCDRFTRSLV